MPSTLFIQDFCIHENSGILLELVSVESVFLNTPCHSNLRHAIPAYITVTSDMVSQDTSQAAKLYKTAKLSLTRVFPAFEVTCDVYMFLML